jgi:hypothetical protein
MFGSNKPKGLISFNNSNIIFFKKKYIPRGSMWYMQQT